MEPNTLFCFRKREIITTQLVCLIRIAMMLPLRQSIYRPLNEAKAANYFSTLEILPSSMATGRFARPLGPKASNTKNIARPKGLAPAAD